MKTDELRHTAERFRVVWYEDGADRAAAFGYVEGALDAATTRLGAPGEVLVFDVVTGQVRVATYAWQLPWENPTPKQRARLASARTDYDTHRKGRG